MPGDVLNPATRVLWRTPRCVQLELGEQALILDGVDPALVRSLTAQDTGNAAPRTDLPPAVALRLRRSGFLWTDTADLHDHTSQSSQSSQPGQPSRAPRLAPELIALAATSGQRATQVLDARRQRVVTIHGTSRVAAQLAAILGASGVGRVAVVETGQVSLAHVGPGGLIPADEGRSYGEAAAEATHRAAPEVDTTPPAGDDLTDLVILAADAQTDPDRGDALQISGQPHLVVRVSGGHATIGPLVVPGRTSCLRCADLHRQDRDPAWPALAVQLAVQPRYGTPSEVALATAAAGIAAVHAIQYLDGFAPTIIDGTLEFQLPDWRLRRRTWTVHPECGCGLR